MFKKPELPLCWTRYSELGHIFSSFMGGAEHFYKHRNIPSFRLYCFIDFYWYIRFIKKGIALQLN